MEEEEKSPAGAADAGGGRGPRKPAGKYPKGGRGVSGAGIGSGRPGAVNFVGLA